MGKLRNESLGDKSQEASPEVVCCATETEQSKAQPLLVFPLGQSWGFWGRSDSNFLEHLNHCSELNFCVFAFLYINEDNQKLPPCDKIGKVSEERLEG